MRVIRSVKAMQKISRALVSDSKLTGLVPTMGFLHDGHSSLIQRAKKLADVVIVTIFVNPAQFTPGEDYGAYPRDEKSDLKKIKAAGGDIVFIPKVPDIYPDDFQTYVEVGRISKSLEGITRPTHFRGVTTIVAKLFNITHPDIAVFGMKDYQQAMVIKQMTRDLGFPIRIIIAPTVREKDGLAMSSRNSYFKPEQRKEAVCLYESLKAAKTAVKDESITNTAALKRRMTEIIKSICPSAKIDYIAFADFKSLVPVRKANQNTICLLAVLVHGVRLIDNMKMA